MPAETWPCRRADPHPAHGGRTSFGEYRCPGADPTAPNPPTAAPQPAQEPPAAPGTGTRCDTCSSTGWIKQEGQIGVPGSGCTHGCPDCEVGQAQLARRELLETDQTDTPEAHSGAEGLILGRALLDRDGDVWRPDVAGKVDRDYVERVWGPIRGEVLLVPVEAGPVLEAARALVASWGHTETTGEAWLAAAVDAATSRQPTTVVSPERGAEIRAHANAAADKALTTALDEDVARQAIAALKAGNVACVQTIDRDMQAFAELPDCEACDGCGKQVPEDWYGTPDRCPPECSEGHTYTGQCQAATEPVQRNLNPLVDDPREPGTSLHPEPAGGPGWDRIEVTDLAAACDQTTGRWAGAGRQIRALLADRDRLRHWGGVHVGRAELAEQERRDFRDALRVEQEAHRAARAELAEVTAQVETAYRAMTEAQRQRDQARAELEQVRALKDRIYDEARDTRATLRHELAEVTAERDRYRQHSITLNTIAWKIATALGDVPDGAEQIEGNPLEQAERLIRERDTARVKSVELRERLAKAEREAGEQQGLTVHAERERDAARADLAEATAERDRLRKAVDAELASHRESRTTVEQLRYENEALRADLSWHCAAREALAAALLPAHDAGWECTCNCEDKECHDGDCRMGHRADCPADCTSPCPGLVDRLRAELADARAEAARLREQLGEAATIGARYIAKYEDAQAERDAARAELDKVDAILRQHGIHHPAGAQGVLDLAGLLVDAKEEAETARRASAADTLEWAAGEAAVDAEHRQVLHDFASAVRAGELETPTRQDGDTP